MVVNRTSSVPISVLHYSLDKAHYSGLEFCDMSMLGMLDSHTCYSSVKYKLPIIVLLGD